MHRVVPSDEAPTLIAAKSRHIPWTFVGCGYIVMSTVCSMWYLYLVHPTLANDVWWANYSSTRDQALLIDVFNALLPTRSSGSVDILSRRAAVDKAYAAAVPTTTVYAAYSRQVILTELTSVEYAVRNLRSMDGPNSLWMGAQYCWVDFDQRFEIAHTAARQARCRQRYSSNGAVYMESMLRNQDWNDFMTFNGDLFAIGIQNWLVQSEDGLRWVAATASARNTTSVDNEVAFWKRHSITTFTLQWQNQLLTGMSDVIVLENALGMQQQLVLRSSSYAEVTWTSVLMYWTIVNDLYYMMMVNRSLVRTANNSFATDPAFNWDELPGTLDGYPTPASAFRRDVGPFLCVDTLLVSVPPPMLELLDNFDTFVQDLSKSSVATPDHTFFPAPPAWTNSSLLFYGGSPLCIGGGPQYYVQNTFGFHDSCGKQTPLSVDFSTRSNLFALLALESRGVQLGRVCMAVALPGTCQQLLRSTIAARQRLDSIPPSLRTLFDHSARVISTLNVGIMQFASSMDGFNMTLLFEPLLRDPSFEFFGWMMALEWMQGQREVVRFDGDVASMTLISTVDVPLFFYSGANSLATATHGLYYMVAYTSGVLAVVCGGCILTTFSCRPSTFQGSDLFWFNHVVGSVWVGRPLALLRAGTAILILSSTQLRVSTTDEIQQSRFEFHPRHWLSTCVIAGEATWALYVTIDFLTVAAARSSMLLAPLSCAIAWAVLVVMELRDPVLPSGWVKRSCSSENMDQALNCSSGGVRIGSFDRVWAILMVQGVATCVAMIGVATANSFVAKSSSKPDRPYQRYILGVADNYFSTESATDVTSQLMAGLIPWIGGRSLDIKLWHLNRTNAPVVVSTCPRSSATTTASDEALPIQRACLSERVEAHLCRLCRLLAVAYAVGGIGGSFLYLQVTQVNLTNDLYWAAFNMTGIHVYVSNWLNKELFLGVRTRETPVDVDSINQDGPFDQVSRRIVSAASFGQVLQYSELTGIHATVVGLRSSDACDVPWIFTQYCFVDLGQRWELANTAARQDRCKSMTDNGAVFLETILRNVDRGRLTKCWGSAMDIAVFDYVKQTMAGQIWMNDTFATSKPSVDDEVAYWTRHGVGHFTTQWQNFKSLGLVNSYAVTNVYGMSYPFKLQNVFSEYRFERQTTFKMYWAFAHDLLSVANNASAIGGHSFVRTSPNYAFANVSIESVMGQSGLLPFPLPNALRLVQSEVGTFGSVDMVYVPCPPVVQSSARRVFAALRTALAQTTDAQDAYTNLPSGLNVMNPVPKEWIDMNFFSLGGSLLCPDSQPGHISIGLQGFVAWHRECSYTQLLATISYDRQNVILAVVMSELLSKNSSGYMARICERDGAVNSNCVPFLESYVAFVGEFIAAHLTPADIATMASEAFDAVTALQVEFMQYGMLDESSDMEIFRKVVLDPADEYFSLYAWIFLTEWVVGSRDVVSFRGDHGNLTLITEFQPFMQYQVSTVDFPVNAASYLRSAVWYITSLMIVVAVLLLVYVALSRGHVDLMNLFKLQRVGAIVWVGRPLLFVRSLTAIGVLATATLELHYSGHITSFKTVQVPWYKTVLAANEITWLGAVVNDMALVVTQEYTSIYGTYNTLLVWLVTAMISIAIPPSHSMTIDKQCHIARVDFDIVCTTGHLEIGQYVRLVGLVAVVCTCNVLCYTVARLAVKAPKPTPLKSVFLYAGAKFMFSTAEWLDGGVYYMDRMSAAMNGILTVRQGSIMYGLDIKLWRTLRVNLDDTTPHTLAAKYALPLHMTNEYEE